VKKSAGFTLIEVLVSVVVLSTGIIFVLHAFETATVALSEMRDAIWASNVAQSEIDKMRVRGATGVDIGNGYWTGRTATYYSDFIWERNIRSAQLGGGEGAPDVRHVVLGVTREGASRMYKYETYIRVVKPPSGGEGG
jgi:prepilin-type N-terminal cleavage/methylation domain-containing protein